MAQRPRAPNHLPMRRLRQLPSHLPAAPRGTPARPGSRPTRAPAGRPQRPRPSARAAAADRPAPNATGGSARARRSPRSARGPLESAGLGDGDRMVERDHRRGRELEQALVEPGDLGPVRAPSARRDRVLGGDRRLQLVAADRSRAQRPRQQADALVDLGPSQRERSWSAISTISPPGPVRALRRESCSSISATTPSTSGSSGISAASSRPSRSASAHSSGRTRSLPQSPRSPR